MTQPLNLTKTCLVLDCFALAYRAYYGLPSSIRTRLRPGHQCCAGLLQYHLLPD